MISLVISIFLSKQRVLKNDQYFVYKREPDEIFIVVKYTAAMLHEIERIEYSMSNEDLSDCVILIKFSLSSTTSALHL